MSDDPAHKAMLYFLEILMNSNGPLTISQLAGRFGSRTFSSDMRTACGGNETGLKKFLLKYPSLFTVRGNMVSLFDGKSSPEYPSEDTRDEKALRRRSLPDVSMELEAVSFFQGKLVRKEERWVSVKSLAGHLSQASADVRSVVGPQLEFRNWLLKHPHIFDVQGELVGLRDGVSAMATSTIPGRGIDRSALDGRDIRQAVPPKTPPPQRRGLAKSPAAIRRSRSFGDRLTSNMALERAPIVPQEAPSMAASVPIKKRPEPITMTANEYKAVIFLKEVVEKQGGGLALHDITTHYGTTSEAVRTTIGWTRAEQEDFLRKHSSIFVISEDGRVSLVKNAKLNVIITGSKPSIPAVRTLNARKGQIFHVAKLWGIIDLGKHEHVFFDKSIMRRPIDDLTKYFQAGEVLCFNAVLAPKSSRAKWRATHVWKDLEAQPSGSESDLSLPEGGMLSPAASVEDEINQFLPRRQGMGFGSDVADSDSSESEKYRDAAPSGAGVVPVYNFSRDSESESEKSEKSGEKSLTLVPESYQMSESSMRDISKAEYTKAIHAKPQANGALVNGNIEGTKEETKSRLVSVACQTVSTGDIIATQLVYES